MIYVGKIGRFESNYGTDARVSANHFRNIGGIFY